jgi:hypothetical protein
VLVVISLSGYYAKLKKCDFRNKKGKSHLNLDNATAPTSKLDGGGFDFKPPLHFNFLCTCGRALIVNEQDTSRIDKATEL